MNSTPTDPNSTLAPPPKPIAQGGPSESWAHFDLYKNVLSALYALPGRFHSPLVIEGVMATDLHTMNTALGAAIEQSVVDSLNELRSLWDPQNRYANYSFARQSQTFPDVLLRTTDPDATEPILMGIELKGWFAIAKEAEPSARFYASEHACADADLLVVMPWLFDSVVSGRPRLMKPIIAEAKHVARVRNWWWEYVRQSKEPTEKRGIIPAPHLSVYPSKSDKYSDKPISDGGGNFGRIARCGVIDDEVAAVSQELALGIPVHGWRRFLLAFSEKADHSSIDIALSSIEAEYKRQFALSPEYASRIAEKHHEIADLLKEGAEAAATAASAPSHSRTTRLSRRTRTLMSMAFGDSQVDAANSESDPDQ